MRQQDLSKIYFIILLILASILMIVFASSFIHALIFAFILGGILAPYNEKIHRKFNISRTISAVIICIIAVVIILVPFIVIVFSATQESLLVYSKLTEFISSNSSELSLNRFATSIHDRLTDYNVSIPVESISDFFNKIISDSSDTILSLLRSVTSNILKFLAQFFLMLLMIIGILGYGYLLRDYILALFPNEKKTDVFLLIEKFNKMNKNTLIVNLGVGVLQATAVGIFMYFAGFEAFLFWSLLIAIAAWVPVAGILTICLPLSIYYYVQGTVVISIVFLVYCIAVSLISENLVKAKIMGKGAQINSLIMLLSVIGGVSTFGILGIFYGPLVLGIFLTLVEIYKSQTIEDPLK